MILYKTIYFRILPQTEQLWHWGTFHKIVLYSTTFNVSRKRFIYELVWKNLYLYDISNLTLFVVIVSTCLKNFQNVNRPETSMFLWTFCFILFINHSFSRKTKKNEITSNETTRKYELNNVFDEKMFDSSNRPRHLSKVCISCTLTEKRY